MQAPVVADPGGQRVEVGLHELGQLAEALDLGDDLVLVADRLQHARVGREAGLAAALAREPELDEQHLGELLRRADHELLARELPDLALELRGVGADAGRGLLEAAGVELDADLLGLAQHAHERQLDLGQQVGRARARRAARAGGRRARAIEHRRAAACSSSDVDGEAALLGQLVEREAAAGGVEQVGGDLGVEGEVGRDLAERLGVVGDDRAVAGGGDELGRVVDLAGERRGRRRGVGARSASPSRPGAARPRGPRAATATSTSSSPGSSATSAGVPSRASIVRASAASGRGIASISAAASASSSRRSGSRSSQSRNTGRTPERSTSRVISASRSMSTGTSRTIVASCLESRAASACSVRFCLRLAPEISSTLAEHASRGRRSAAAARTAVLSPMPGTPGMLSRRVALEADEVGDQLGRDAVAVDHALAVVDLRVGDAARGAS